MGRAFYRFGHDLALRLENGQAFALKDAELVAFFSPADAPVCCLRGSFTPNSYRGLIARGVLPPNQELQALAQPVTVQLNLRQELAAVHGKSAEVLIHIGRRLDQNSLQDQMARSLLSFDVWQLATVTPSAQPGSVATPTPKPAARDSAQDAAISALVTEMADELWSAAEIAAEIAGEPTNAPQSDAPMALGEAVESFFADEGWGWETVTAVENVLRTVYDGQNGTWMCYTRILPELDQVVFYSICPIPVPSIAIPIMLEFLARVNSDLVLGNFEIEFDAMQVRFRTGVDVTDVGLTPFLFRNLVFQNLAVMDIYLPEILGIVAGVQSAMPAE